MRTKNLFQSLLAGYLIFAFAIIGLFSFAYFKSMEASLIDAAQKKMQNQLIDISKFLPGYLKKNKITLRQVCREWGPLVGARMTLVKHNGDVLCDSYVSVAQMDNHLDRLEIYEALQNQIGKSVRYSHTQNQKMVYVALRLNNPAEFNVVFSLGVPWRGLIEGEVSHFFKKNLGTCFVLVLLILLGLMYLFHLTQPLGLLENSVLKLSEGNLKEKLLVSGSLEMQKISHAINQLTSRLQQRIDTIQKQQAELDAVFAGMDEGVIALDSYMRVRTINFFASKLLNLSIEYVLDKKIQEVTRNSFLVEIGEKVLKDKSSIVQEVVLRLSDYTRFLRVTGSPLRDVNGGIDGVVIVLNDITKIRELENLRSEFVANVSHELKTPISSIMGAAETLRDGAMSKKEDAEKFIQMILRNGNRLHRIILDLLSISKLEHQSTNLQQEKKPVELGISIQNVVDALQLLAEEKNIALRVIKTKEIHYSALPSLIEQAISNLVENAIRYSPEGKSVTVKLLQVEKEILIDVTDEGVGIAEEHLPRLFERFYRVEKARSRQDGGTGLGLSIVKHICQLHGGYVRVKSAVGKGSSFTIHLPASV